MIDRQTSVVLKAMHDENVRCLFGKRPLLIAAMEGDAAAVRVALNFEIETEKEADRVFWEPLKVRLGELRREARKQ